MQVEPITSHMLPVIFDWWQLRGLGEMDSDILPPAGYLASDDEGPAAAAWLYQPIGCKVAILDWLVTRPWMGYMTSRAACRLVFETIATRARADGATRLFATVHPGGMRKEAEDCGFTIAATGMTHLVKHL